MFKLKCLLVLMMIISVSMVVMAAPQYTDNYGNVYVHHGGHGPQVSALHPISHMASFGFGHRYGRRMPIVGAVRGHHNYGNDKGL